MLSEEEQKQAEFGWPPASGERRVPIELTPHTRPRHSCALSNPRRRTLDAVQNAAATTAAAAAALL